jgi:6,7-dimethyl-8-ribityllumazine synthase
VAEFTGEVAAQGRRFAVVASRFNEAITQKLAEGAVSALVWVPGAWELPAAARALLASDRYDAIVAVGAVIRGDTPHFDFVAGEASRGLADASAEFHTPVGFGLLTCDTVEQAEARAGGLHGNKGADAARAAVEMADLFARLAVDEDAT